jgi:hypothetical protein
MRLSFGAWLLPTWSASAAQPKSLTGYWVRSERCVCVDHRRAEIPSKSLTVRWSRVDSNPRCHERTCSTETRASIGEMWRRDRLASSREFFRLRFGTSSVVNLEFPVSRESGKVVAGVLVGQKVVPFLVAELRRGYRLLPNPLVTQNSRFSEYARPEHSSAFSRHRNLRLNDGHLPN